MSVDRLYLYVLLALSVFVLLVLTFTGLILLLSEIGEWFERRRYRRRYGKDRL